MTTIDLEKILAELDDKPSTFKADFSQYLVNNYVRQQVEQADWTDLENTKFVANKRAENGLPMRAIVDKRTPPQNFSVGIIGAGIAGLYTALICETLRINWHIIEANPSRLGGRLYTKYLNIGKEEVKKHDYYDIGAMRYPKTPVMRRTFDLFKKTDTKLGYYNMKSENEKRHGEKPITTPVEPAPLRYNDVTLFRPTKTSKDPFNVSKFNKGPVPDNAVYNPDRILDDAYDRFRDRIKNAYLSGDAGVRKEAWEYLMKHDRFSLRDYLTFVEGEEFEATHWLETLNAGTGWFDQAFSEHVLESLAFEFYKANEEIPQGEALENGASSGPQINGILGSIIAPKPEGEPEGIDARVEEGRWYYIQNGSASLVNNTIRRIQEVYLTNQARDKDSSAPEVRFGEKEHRYPEVKPNEAFSDVMKKITLGKRVVKIGKTNYNNPQPMEVWHVNTEGPPGEPTPARFDVVINTTTLSAMQKMDLLELELPYDTKAAIRMLRYDTSTKVAIRFKTRWWYNDGHNLDFKLNIRGGLGKTDLPLRTCVYPSYNVDDKTDGNSFVLLCSYTWGADSERIAAMIKGMKEPSTDGQDELAVVMLDNLARLHTTTPEDYKKLLAYITKDFDRYHAYDWSNDPYTCGGAFALYSAHQFSRLYPSLVRPLADARLHIVGEAASAHHAWVVGALDSAYRGLYNAFKGLQFEEQVEALKNQFGYVGEIDEETDYLQIALEKTRAKTQALKAATAAPAA